jgi:hypothetical protein
MKVDLKDVEGAKEIQGRLTGQLSALLEGC